MLFLGTKLICPAGRTAEPNLEIEMADILQAEARQSEVAFVTPQKAPELLRAFNLAWRDLHDLVVRVSTEALYAQRQVERCRALLVVDKIPNLLVAKSLASNEANREALVVLDPQYQALQEVADEIDALVTYFRGKLRSFENAFSSVKKIMSDDGYGMLMRANPNLKGGTDSTPPHVDTPAVAERSSVGGNNRFGRARY